MGDHPCRPSYLIFPRIVDWPESHLERISRARAMEEMLPEMVFVLDPGMARRQFRICTRLVEATECFRLHFGEDVLALPGLFDRVLSPARRGS